MKTKYKFATVVLSTLPIWAEYAFFSGTSLASFLLLLLIPFFISDYNKVAKVRQSDIIWFISIVSIGLLGYILNSSEYWFSNSLFINNHWQIFLFFVPLLLFTNRIDYRLFLKSIIVFGISASLICFFQRVILIMTGTYPNIFYLPGLELNRDITTMSRVRPAAFFSEPAHMSIYLLPILYTLLLSKKYLFSIIIALGIICSGSSTGLVALPVVFLYWVLSNRTKKIYTLLSFVIALIVVYYVKTYLVDDIDSTVMKFSSDEANENVRLFKPFQYFTLFEPLNYIFGLGLNQLSGLVGNTFLASDDNNNFANAFLYMIICYGVAGFISSVIYFKKIWKKSNRVKGYFIIFIMVALSSPLLFNSQFLYLLTFLHIGNSLNEYLNMKGSNNLQQ